MHTQSRYDPIVVKITRKDIIGATEENGMWNVNKKYNNVEFHKFDHFTMVIYEKFFVHIEIILKYLVVNRERCINLITNC